MIEAEKYIGHQDNSYSIMAVFDKKNAAGELVLRKKQDDSKPRNFLSITFKKNLERKIGYRQYDYDKPWIFPVKFQSRRMINRRAAGVYKYETYTGEELAAMSKGYEIKMDENVPDFEWYRKTFTDYTTTPTAPEIKEMSGF